MRVNIYAEEMTDRVELITKTIEGETFVGLRFYLELPISVPSGSGHHVTHRGPFIHRPGDDDSSAVTFWGKRDLRKVLSKAIDLLDGSPMEKLSKTVSTGGFMTQAQAGGIPRQDHCPETYRKDPVPEPYAATSICGHGYIAKDCPHKTYDPHCTFRNNA